MEHLLWVASASMPQQALMDWVEVAVAALVVRKQVAYLEPMVAVAL
jgi:hypothetical protein